MNIDFSNLKIIVFGDVMIDSYLWGTVDRMSPEAPVPVVSVKKREKRLGGAANVALNLKSLGVNPVVVSVIGQDDDAKEMIKLFVQNGLSTEGLLQSKERVTTIKHRIISDKHLLRVDSEQTDDISTSLENQLLEIFTLLSSNCQCVIFQDYNKGVLTKNIIEKGIELSKRSNIPTAIDPKKKNFLTYRECSLFKPNLKEINEALGTDIKGTDLDGLRKIGKDFLIQQNHQRLMITLSENGAILMTKDDFTHVPAHIRNIVDVSGAGDTVISVASAALGLNLSDSNILNYSNLSGGLVCEEIGVVPINFDKLLSELNHLN